MLSEALIIGLVVLLLCSAMCFYMYVRLSFLEKKVTVMESILVDVRVALDTVMMEHNPPPPVPISHTPGAQLSAPAPLDSSESEPIPEENFYSTVLEQAHEKAEEVDAEKFAETSPPTEVSESSSTVVEPNYDAMTRKELAAIAEKKGLRVKRDMNRSDVLTLLRRSNPLENDLVPTGTENVSGPVGASLDSSLPVALGNNGAELENSL
jgi:hypothetical protein